MTFEWTISEMEEFLIARGFQVRLVHQINPSQVPDAMKDVMHESRILWPNKPVAWHPDAKFGSSHPADYWLEAVFGRVFKNEMISYPPSKAWDTLAKNAKWIDAKDVAASIGVKPDSSPVEKSIDPVARLTFSGFDLSFQVPHHKNARHEVTATYKHPKTNLGMLQSPDTINIVLSACSISGDQVTGRLLKVVEDSIARLEGLRDYLQSLVSQDRDQEPNNTAHNTAASTYDTGIEKV